MQNIAFLCIHFCGYYYHVYILLDVYIKCVMLYTTNVLSTCRFFAFISIPHTEILQYINDKIVIKKINWLLIFILLCVLIKLSIL